MSLTRRGRLTLLAGILALLVLVPFIGLNIYMRSVGVWGASDPGKEVSVEIPEGASTQEVGKILADAGVIKSTTGWRIALFLDGGGTEDIQAGIYQVPTGLTAGDALQRLLETGPTGPEFVNVTFPEGSWLTDFARILGDGTHITTKEFMRVLESGEVRSELVPDGKPLEGALFPSTYQIIDEDTATSVARRLIAEMEKQVASIDMRTAESLNLTPYDVLIVASMIEAETRVDEERPMVARVIYNRLREGIALGIDATVIYALGEHKTELTASDLEIDSPYNTRLLAGLPPTPIGAPGLESLQAAAEPANGEWLYYVLGDCEGNHKFSVSYDEFLQNKAAYQQLSC